MARLPLFGNFSYSAIFCAILTNFKLNKLLLEAGKGRNPSRRPPIRRREEYNGNTVQLTRMRTGGTTMSSIQGDTRRIARRVISLGPARLRNLLCVPLIIACALLGVGLGALQQAQAQSRDEDVVVAYSISW